MKLLLTSAGVTNASIRDSLVGLLGKSIAACDALCIPTAEYGHPICTPASAWRFVAGKSPSPMCGLGWKSLGLLELTALPSIAALLPTLHEKVWVGVSAGSMVMTPRIGQDFVNWKSPAGDDSTLGIVDFSARGR